MANKTLADTQELAGELHSLAIHLLRKLRREDDQSGLNAPRLSALSVVVFGGPLTLGQLAAAEQVRPPTMTRIVDALEQQGLVTRKRDPGDARSVQIATTAAGRRLLLAGRERRVRVLAEQIGALNARERQELIRAAAILRRVVASM